ncbi:MAG TPA: glutathione S-transferase family protein [Aliidongia sp.]|uniref:glutathione S-transferase family protein n=1 Tax=Aliidongia sp. TaxID=1914230 RepID=UPI002DDDB795|nr:glutathione S-transferase family protein [Aliidongia sp.]HEV2673975.1 glutathione S-transferase family protein [Aliidongia sp.]
MARPLLFGAAYSVYVRIARLTLEEKGVAHDLVPVDVFAADGLPADYLQRQPFGRIPAFEHEGFRLFETGAITRYVDEAFPGPRLQPEGARDRARVNQIISILDNYAYRTLVWDIYVERVSGPAKGRPADEARIAAALPQARRCLDALVDLMGDGPWLAGSDLSLADLHAAPMIAYCVRAPEGRALIERAPRLQVWWGRMAARPGMLATEFVP